KIWWAIPLVVVVLFITIRRTFWEITHFNRPLYSFVGLYEKNTFSLLNFHFFDFWGAIITLSTRMVCTAQERRNDISLPITSQNNSGLEVSSFSKNTASGISGVLNVPRSSVIEE
ncbi:MAG: hypothetical protein U9N36_07195, partial [Euryarchaeota archaeon]|nr:hypothetical protein [Euryarchaeota archaeon]